MKRMFRTAVVLLGLTSSGSPVLAAEDAPSRSPAIGGSSMGLNPSSLVGKPLFTEDGVAIGMVTEIIRIAGDQFLIIAELREGFASGQRTVQISSRAASFGKDGVRLQTTAAAFRRSLESQKETASGVPSREWLELRLA